MGEWNISIDFIDRLEFGVDGNMRDQVEEGRMVGERWLELGEIYKPSAVEFTGTYEDDYSENS